MNHSLITLLLVSLFYISKAQHTVAPKSKARPFVLGVIDEIQSSFLSEKRTVNIYLPEGYNANDSIKYPVIYLLDGSADEDFIHVSGLAQYCSFPWVNFVPKSIVVGIANVDRKRDFTYPTTVAQDKKDYPTTGGSEKFIAFIEKELQPYISRNYRTNSSNTLIGESLGGLLAAEILLKKPALFDHYVIVSPSLWWDDGSLLLRKPEDIRQATRIYIGVGTEGHMPGKENHDMEVDARKLAAKLQGAKNVKLNFDFLSAENHATIFHQAVYDAFRNIYTGK